MKLHSPDPTSASGPATQIFRQPGVSGRCLDLLPGPLRQTLLWHLTAAPTHSVMARRLGE